MVALQAFLSSAGLDSGQCAKLLGLSPRIFNEWAAGQRPLPPSVVPLLSTVTGITQSRLISEGRASEAPGDLIPAVWFKFRGDALIPADREYVLLIRQLGHFVDQLE